MYKLYDTTSQAWGAMLQAMSGAKKSIYWEIYILVDDSAGNQFFDVLIEKAKSGIEVKIVVDYWGSFWLSRKKIDELRAAGVDIRLFQERRHKWRGLWNIIVKRNHRKILIVDEQYGFIGGVNVHRSMQDWLDVNLRVEGKAVRSLLRAFARSYILCGGDKKAVRHLLKYRYRIEHDEINFVYEHSGRRFSRVRSRYVGALKKARERVIFFSPYYFPDKEFLNAMWEARKRGVYVDLLIPFRTDVKIATYTAYAGFSLMKKYGVRIHLIKKMMHGKGIIVDDEWAMLGSSNFDPLSFYHSQEANVQVKDKRMVKKLKRVIGRWIKSATPFDSVEWEKRSWWHRLKERVALRLYRYWFNLK